MREVVLTWHDMNSPDMTQHDPYLMRKLMILTACCFVGASPTRFPAAAPTPSDEPPVPTGPTPGLIEGEELACIAMAKAFPGLQSLSGK